MIILDTALQKREAEGKPIRVGMVGAGAMGKGIALQILSYVPGMDLVAISNRSVERARDAFLSAGVDSFEQVSNSRQMEAVLHSGRRAVTDDPMLICESDGVDVVLEVTGTIEFGAQVVMRAIRHGKHVVTMNAELQGTLGPILQVHAQRAGVVITDSDGDQPGVIMNLLRFVQGIGCKPVLAGNIKGLQDPYRNPTTQAEFASKHHLAPNMAASFADGSKVSFEMAIVANATGFKVGRLGMYGPKCGHVSEAKELFPFEQMMDQGLVDYVLGAEPGPGVFVLGYNEHPFQRHFLKLYKLGEGPLYVFYRPYHLCHFEVPSTIGRAVLFEDATIKPLAGPEVDVVATAKRDLKAGETIDGIGFYMTYGQCANSEDVIEENYLPMGLAEGCRLRRNVGKDQVLRYSDVVVPKGRYCDELRAEQNHQFATSRFASIAS